MMHSLKHMERLQQLHKRIKTENTGSPATLAKQLATSRRNLYFMIGRLKLYGANIVYSRKRKTFYYKGGDFDIKVTMKIEIIHKGITKNIYGGRAFF